MNRVQNKLFWKSVSDSFKDGTFLELKLWIAKQYINLSSSNFIYDICDIKIAFSYSSNPIKVCLLFIELLEILQKNTSTQQNLINEAIKNVTDLIEYFIQNVRNQNDLKDLLLEEDMENRTVLHILKSYSLLLKQIESIVTKIWGSNFDSDSFGI